MSSDSFAPALERSGIATSPQSTGPLARIFRLVALAIAIARMWMAALRRVGRLAAKQRQTLIETSARRLLDALAVEVVVRGRRPDPRRPVLLVANHISWLDSYAIHTVADACFVAKTEVRSWPVIGTIAERFGTLFIERWKRRDAWRTKNAAAALLRARRSVACFPEGTTSEGQGMRGFFTALFQAAVDAQVAVQPLAIRYYTAEGTPTTAPAYVDGMSFMQSLGRVLRERRLIVELVFGTPLEPRDSRRVLCRAAEEAVREALALPRHWLIELAADRERSGRDRPANRLAPASA